MRPHGHLRRQNDTRGGLYGADEGLAMGWLFAHHARLLDVGPGCLERPVDVYGYGALAWNGEGLLFSIVVGTQSFFCITHFASPFCVMAMALPKKTFGTHWEEVWFVFLWQRILGI